MTQKAELQVEGEFAYVARMARAKIEGLGDQVHHQELRGGANSGNA
jgi:hypothetical protein